MFTNRLSRYFFMLVIVIAITACATKNELPPEISTATVVSALPNSSENPLPIAVWNLDGDGTASVGNSALAFSGAYEFSDTAVAFDGYTGNASTSAPGPIDTTASFSVSAWMNYADRVSDFSVAICQLGEVTCAFALGVGDTSQWWFGMKKRIEAAPNTVFLYMVDKLSHPRAGLISSASTIRMLAWSTCTSMAYPKPKRNLPHPLKLMDPWPLDTVRATRDQTASGPAPLGKLPCTRSPLPPNRWPRSTRRPNPRRRHLPSQRLIRRPTPTASSTALGTMWSQTKSHDSSS